MAAALLHWLRAYPLAQEFVALDAWHHAAKLPSALATQFVQAKHLALGLLQ